MPGRQAILNYKPRIDVDDPFQGCTPPTLQAATLELTLANVMVTVPQPTLTKDVTLFVDLMVKPFPLTSSNLQRGFQTDPQFVTAIPTATVVSAGTSVSAVVSFDVTAHVLHWMRSTSDPQSLVLYAEDAVVGGQEMQFVSHLDPNLQSTP